MSSCRITMTQLKMACDLYQDQLLSCAMPLLHIVQFLVLGTDAEKKVQDAEALNVTQLHQKLQSVRSHPNSFAAFTELIMNNNDCKTLPQIIMKLSKAYIECLQLINVAVPLNPLEKLWVFMLRTCFERPILLHVHDDRKGTQFEMFQNCLSKFYAECLLPVPEKK